MPDLNSHMIKKQVLDVSIDTQQNADDIQKEIKETFYKSVLPLIEKTFDKYAEENVVLRIDTLSLDIGNVNLGNLEEDFVDKIKIKLDEELAEYIHQTKTSTSLDKGAKKITEPVAALELIEQFLRTGTYPWWVRKSLSGSVEGPFEDLIQNSSQQTKELLEKYVQNSQVRQRLVYQLSDSLVTKLILLLAGSKSKWIKRVIEDILTTHREKPFVKLGIGTFKQFLLEEVLHYSITDKQVFKDEKRFTDQTLKSISIRVGESYHKVLASVVRSISQLSKGGFVFKSLFPHAVPAIKKELTVTENDENEKNKKLEESEPVDADTVPEVKDLKIKSGKEKYSGDEAEKERRKMSAMGMDSKSEDIKSEEGSENFVDKNLSTEKSELPDQANLNAKLDKKQWTSSEFKEEISGTEERVTPDEIQDFGEQETGDVADIENLLFRKNALEESLLEVDEIYIENSGLVVFGAYLERFLGVLQLTENNEFASDEAVQRAIHVLQYVATGKEETPEHQLALNKLLCGLPIVQPINAGFTLSKEEKEECESLIKAIIENWGALKNTSVNGFREAFLRREGVLTKNEDGWVLRVERKTLDVLMEKLPWGISIVKLTWMDKPINVEW